MIDGLVSEIKKRKPKKVLLQLPAGIVGHGAEIVEKLAKQNIECILSGDACYGACDIKDDVAKKIGCDLVVHVGHSIFYKKFKTTVPVMYYPWTIDADIDGIDFSVIKEKRICLFTSVQHLHALDKIKKALEAKGKTVNIGGQVLGCYFPKTDNISNVDAFLFVGSGSFHALALKEKTYILDLEKKVVERFDSMKYEKIRFARISNARNAMIFAILVSTKKGQFQLLADAREIKKKLETHDKKAFIVVMDEITNEKLLNVRADAFINTACPRIADDVFSKPFINAQDIDKIFE
jgi:2-(3-amino-3-carboxypropyl)histidine synthase